MVLRRIDPSEPANQSTPNRLPYPTSPSAPLSSIDPFADSQNGTQSPLEQQMDSMHIDEGPSGNSKTHEPSSLVNSEQPNEKVEVPKPLNIRKSRDMTNLEESQQTQIPSILQVHKPSAGSATNTPPPKQTSTQPAFELDGASAHPEEERKETNPFRRARSPEQQETMNPAAIYQDEQLANPFQRDGQHETTFGSPDDAHDPTHQSASPPHELQQEHQIKSARSQAEQPSLIPVEKEVETNRNPFFTQDASPGLPPNESRQADAVKSAYESSHEPPREPSLEPGLSSSKYPTSPEAPSYAEQAANPNHPTSNLQASRQKANEQRNEVYQIRHIRWFDENHKNNPRKSPVLVQNANGPCPLLALVNALVLTTPPDLVTALVETLRTREQVSLGLLLDAVFDELTSGRRGATAQLLPDVADLYSFLVTLHTGMNVNPRFVHPRFNATLSNFAGLDQGASNDSIGQLGGFEETREMRLYSSFAIPLVHGWLPQRTAIAYEAFDRIAQTYEDTQNIQFREEELEQKMREDTLTAEEQAFFFDLTTIKEFMSTWPTQLTDHGLRLIKDTLKPGQTSILFRNDHFSTLYKEPRSGQLMTLVTDAGYATHDEIVWENLVDISGTSSELFSGDFKSVSHNAAGQGEGWATVQGRNQRQRTEQSNTQPAHAGFAGHATHDQEQEDRDFALAMQLQEEEEQRQREAQRRQQHGRQTSGPEVPPRRNQGHPPRDGNALPSYEQAKNDRIFHSSPRRGGHRQQGSTGFGRGSAMPAVSSGNQASGQQCQPGGRGRRSRQTLIEQIPSSTPIDPQAQGGRKPNAHAEPVQNKKENCVIM